MRTLLLVSLALNAFLLLRTDRPVEAEASEDSLVVSSADANGDSRVDISDAVYILDFLFAGGPRPQPIGCAAEPIVAGTGQVGCYDDEGQSIDCDDPRFPGQDGSLNDCDGENRFVDNRDGTITDTCTGLMWQQDLGFVSAVNWQGSLEYCATLELGGHDDWRLPTIREIQSIVDYNRTGPAFDPIFRALETRYWSSTTVVNNRTHAWVVNGIFGQVAAIVDKPSALAFPRAVRRIR
ncbi:MAG: DUF1566 domain-containing protein [Planctomycetota bacterium]